MATLKSVKLLDDNKTLVPYDVQPLYAKTLQLGKALTTIQTVIQAMVFARDLRIAHGDDERYWKWKRLQLIPTIEVAELKKVCWLEVTGKYNLKHLKNGMYKFEFILMVEEGLDFDSTPTKFSITFPCKEEPGVVMSEIVKYVNIMDFKGKTNRFIHVELANCVKCTGSGEVNFSLTNLSPYWKKGLTIVGVYIQPS